ncbi:MAG: SDR family oxidoreductase [Planctomycetota bacterium]
MPTYLITGANRGIGLALAKHLAARGDTVIATAREQGKATELAEVASRVEELDVTDPASVSAFAERVTEPIDVLINNAGFYPNRGEPLDQIDTEAILRAFDVNAVGPVRVTRALLPRLRAGGHKKLVHITSVMGSLRSVDDANQKRSIAYRASKAALNMAALLLSNELEPEGIISAMLHPGWVQTDMGGGKAPLTTEQSAAGLVKVIDGLKPRDNGCFRDYQGKKIPW